MTIGIGGWGSRRKPMSLVRAILRSDAAATSPSSPTAGPTSGMLCAAGKVRKVVYGFVSLDSIPLEPHFRAARQTGADRGRWSSTRACSSGACRPRRWRVPFLPTRAGLGSDVIGRQPAAARRSRSPYDDGEELVAMPALPPRRRARPPEPGRRSGATPSSSAPTSTSTTCSAWRPTTALRVVRADRRHRRPARRGLGPHAAHQPAAWSTAWSRRPAAPTSRPASPTTSATRRSSGSTPPPPATRRVGGVRRRYLDCDEAEYQASGAVSADERATPTRAEVCVVAVRRGFRGDGEILASPIGTIPMIGGRLARATFEPDLRHDRRRGAARRRRPCPSARRRRPEGRRGLDPVPARCSTWSGAGRRHVMMGATQIDRYGNQNIASIGAWAQAQGAAARRPRRARATRSTTRRATGCPNHSTRVVRRAGRHRVAASATTGPPRSARRRRASTRSAAS